jgi:photosystem II stability/assembly factor-like uncharacterized protein
MKKLIMVFSLVFFSSLLTFTQQEWFWQNPRPGKGSYNGFTFSDPNNGTIIGIQGQILRTTDGGNSWKWQVYNKNDNFESVYFIDANTGTIVGDKGVIIRTTDGGNTWITQVSGTTNALASVFFTDANNGFVVGNSNTVLRTTNGGNTWTTVPMGSPSVSFQAVHFSNDSNGFIVGSGGAVRRTTDGGNTWFAQNLNFNQVFHAVHFVNDNVGTIVGTSGTIRKTTNGGDTWINQTVGNNAELYSVYYVDENIGFIVAGLTSGGGDYFKTTDGGETWTNHLLGANTSSRKSCIFFNQNDGFVLSQNHILETNDGGENWTNHHKRVELTNFGFQSSAVHILDENNFSIACNDINGSGSRFFKTTDGGESWFGYHFGLTNIGLTTIYFHNEDFGFVLSGFTGDVYRTSDGGISWIDVSTGSSLRLMDFSFLSLYVGTIVGYGGTILRTSDGGNTWINQTSGTTNNLRAVCFVNDAVGTAVGEGNTILRTTNGGLDWVAQISGVSSYDFWDVSFIDENNGIIVGSKGITLRTSDGGSNWISANIGTSTYIKSVTQTDIYNAWLVADETNITGRKGLIYKTTNGGESWVLQRFVGQPLHDISSLNPNFLIAVGEDGYILRVNESIVPVNYSPDFVSPTPSCGNVFTVDIDHPFNFTVAAQDVDAGDVVTLSVSGLPSGSVMNPVLPTAGNPVNSEFSWTPTLADIGTYNLTYEITDNQSTPVSCSFTIEVINDNVAPTFVEPTPVCGSPLTAYVGSAFAFTVSAQDGDATDIISLTSGTLPTGSAMNPVLPAAGNPVNSDFLWTPDLTSVGNHTVTFEITDGYSDPVTCSFNIEVINPNVAPVFVDPTPATGSTLTVYAGSPLVFTLQAEDSDAGNIVELFAAGLPSGSVMNPPLPFAANPVSSEFLWTPSTSDVGTYELIYTAVDNFTAFATCTLTVIVEEVPAIVCPLNQIYWRDNPDLWPVETIILGTIHSYDKPQLLAILDIVDLRDASVILAKQLIAAKLNVANGAPVPTEVTDAIRESDELIEELVIPARIKLLTPVGLAMVKRAGYLWLYNNNLLTRDCSSTLAKLMEYEDEIVIPVSDYTLFDNYPNPFNPATKIMYAVPNNEFVTLKVYNTIGEEVLTLVNEVKQQGIYEVEFNAATLPSGVYLYRIIAGDFVATKKMILMK